MKFQSNFLAVPFDPRHPLQRFCSCECRDAERRWEVWRAGQMYRATPHGKARRREQRSRARSRAKERRLQDAADLPEDSKVIATDTAAATSAEPKVGHQKDGDSEKTCCFRPGCYVRFHVTTRSPRQCFCSSACRNALRRVRQRETHWIQRQGMRSRHRGTPACDVD